MGDDALRSTAPVATALCVVDKNERAIGPWLQIRALFRRESQLFLREFNDSGPVFRMAVGFQGRDLS